MAPALDPDASLEHVFNTPFDSRDGVFTITCWTMLPGEQNAINDTVTYVVDHRPNPVPFQEDFETGLPAGWQTNGFVTGFHNNISQVLAVNLYSFNPSTTTELPRYGVISDGDSLRFDYRITNSVLWGGDAVQSDFAATNFTIVYTDLSEPWPGVGNLNSDPLFVNSAARNFRLLPGSPCINSGVVDPTTGALDLDGQPRLSGAHVDIGADETVSSSIATHLSIFNPSSKQFMIHVEGSSGSQHVVERTADFLIWTPVWTNQILPFDYTVENTNGFFEQFYRVTTTP